MSLLHPNVAVALSHSGLRVEERHPDTPLSTEPGIVVVTLLHSISVILLSKPENKVRATYWFIIVKSSAGVAASKLVQSYFELLCQFSGKTVVFLCCAVSTRQYLCTLYQITRESPTTAALLLAYQQQRA